MSELILTSATYKINELNRVSWPQETGLGMTLKFLHKDISSRPAVNIPGYVTEIPTALNGSQY